MHAASWLGAAVLVGNAITISLFSPPVVGALRRFRRTRVLPIFGNVG